MLFFCHQDSSGLYGRILVPVVREATWKMVRFVLQSGGDVAAFTHEANAQMCRLLDHGLRHNFLLHLLNLWDNSLLNSRAIIDCMLIVDHLAVCLLQSDTVLDNRLTIVFASGRRKGHEHGRLCWQTVSSFGGQAVSSLGGCRVNGCADSSGSWRSAPCIVFVSAASYVLAYCWRLYSTTSHQLPSLTPLRALSY